MKEKSIKGNKLLPLVFIMACVGSNIYAAETKYTSENGYNNCAFSKNGEEYFLKSALNRQHRVIFDVGANIGGWSSVALKHAPLAQVHAFEPHPRIFSVLKKRLLRRNVVLNELALSDRQKRIDLWVWGDDKDFQKSGLNGLYYRPILKKTLKVDPKKVTVHAIPLDKYCHRHQIKKIDLLKIDTEGSEWDVLKGSINMIKNHKIQMIQFEYGGCYLDSKTTLKDVYHFLTSSGYTIYRLLPQGKLRIKKWSDDLECYQYSNYVALLERY